MSMVNIAENLIRISPPIPWADIQDGPVLAALIMRFDIPAGADPLNADERWQATGISAVGGNWSFSYLEHLLQKVVDHYGDREYSGHIEVRSGADGGTAAWRIVVRGKHVVRVSAVLGWPPEQVDDSEDGLMEILADHNVHIGDEIDPGDHRNPYPGYVPADETGLPDVLLAWRDAAVQKAVLADRLRAVGIEA